MRKFLRFTLTLVVVSLSAMSVAAADAKIGNIEIDHAYSKAMIPSAKVADGYMKITNSSTSPDRLLSVSTSFAGETQRRLLAG